MSALARVGWPEVLGKQDPVLANGQKPPCYQAIPLRAAASFLALLDLIVAENRPAEALVLHGSADTTIPCRPACAIARRMLGDLARVEIVPDAGHLLPRTDAGPRVVHQVISWLAERG